MPEYRAYAVDDDGRFVGFEPLICVDDAAAIIRSRRLLGGTKIEVWSGPRLVSSAAKQPAEALTHEIQEGSMVPKSATT
jgi:hypothetical protein